MTDPRSASPGGLRLGPAPAGLPDPNLAPPVVAEPGDPFAVVRVLELVTRVEAGRAVLLDDLVASLNARYLDWAFDRAVVADALVRQGVAFRAAHHIVGALVAEAERGGVGLDALDDATIAAALAASDDSVALKLADDAALPGKLRMAAALDGALASCDVVGGTAPRRVAAALAAAKARLGA